jgi:hypothetical protein
VTQQPEGSGPDLIGGFQRWLVRSGARGVSRELGDQIRTALGRNTGKRDVWDTATTTPPPTEAPECAWCPVCRAARLMRDQGPGLASHMSTAQDVLAGAVAEAVSIVDAALAATGRAAPRSAGTAPKNARTAPKNAGTAAKGAGHAARNTGAASRSAAAKSAGDPPKSGGVAPKSGGVAPKSGGVAPKTIGAPPKSGGNEPGAAESEAGAAHEPDHRD